MGGKRLYEYARAGLPLPKEINARTVNVQTLELVDFTFDHDYDFPAEEMDIKDKVAMVAYNKSGSPSPDRDRGPDAAAAAEGAAAGEDEVAAAEGAAAGEDEVAAAGEAAAGEAAAGEDEEVAAGAAGGAAGGKEKRRKGRKSRKRRLPLSEDERARKKLKEQEEAAATSAFNAELAAVAEAAAANPEMLESTRPEGKPFAVTLHMTVSSGFYVRSLIHDLGEALSSAAHMVRLVRTQQDSFQVGTDSVIEWGDLMDKPEDVWGPQVEGALNKWAAEKSGSS